MSTNLNIQCVAASSSFTSSKPEYNIEDSDHLNLSQLPHELLLQIFKDLNSQDFSALSCASKALSIVVPSVRSNQERHNLTVFMSKIIEELDSSVSEEIKNQFLDIKKSLRISFRNLSSLNEHIESVKARICPLLPHLTKEQLEQLKTISPPSLPWAEQMFVIAIIWKEVQEADQITDRYQRAEALGKNILALAHQGEFDGVRQVALMITTDPYRSIALGKVVTALIKRGLILDAETFAWEIPSEMYRSTALGEIVSAWVDTKSPELFLKAKELAKIIPDERDRAPALSRIVSTLLDTDKLQCVREAKAFARIIPDPQKRTQALHFVVLSLIKHTRFIEAKKVALMIPDKIYRSLALKNLVFAWVDTKSPELLLKAQALAKTIKDKYWRSDALLKVEVALKKTTSENEIK